MKLTHIIDLSSPFPCRAHGIESLCLHCGKKTRGGKAWCSSHALLVSDGLATNGATSGNGFMNPDLVSGPRFVYLNG
jgi:hypothetical protein